MIEPLIAWCAKNRALTLVVVMVAVGFGVRAFRSTPLDAIPDLSDTQVIVSTEWMGRSPDIVEDQITYPIVTALRGAPGVRYVRGLSMIGDSFVYVVFQDGVDLYWARSRVLEYLSAIQGRLPEGVTPKLGPDATSVGWVFEYALVDTTGQNDLAQLRSFQDWYLRYWLQSVDGVSEVASVGGFVKQYQVDLDPDRLESYKVSIEDVANAIRRSNNEVGGSVIEVAEHEHFVRGRGYVRSLGDLESIPVKVSAEGVPVTLRNLGEIHLGPEQRRGIAELNGDGEVVGGIVIMRQKQNALHVIEGVKKRLEEVTRSFPPGVKLVVTYDRSELIHRAVNTLWHELIQEMLIVSAVIVFFLYHLRSALIPILTLPIAVILAFIPMAGQGLTANIMSLGGIAVAIGAMVDASIIMVENVHKKLEAWAAGGRPGRRDDIVIQALQEVGRPIFFALVVITVSFLPIFTLQATEGRLFRPLAFTKTYSMAFAALLAVTLTPALASWFIRGKIRGEREHPVSRRLIDAYIPVVRFAVRHRRAVAAGAGILLLSTIPVFLTLGSEFMPPLNEGTVLYMPTAPPGISATEAGAVLQQMDRRLKTVPEVATVFGKMGRARTATDPAPLSMTETVVTLKPESQWRKGMTWEALIADMDSKMRFPGMPNIWWMPIQTRNEMLATGVRSAVGVKVYGQDLATIERIGIQIESALKNVRGTRSAIADRVTGGYFLDFDIRREEAARYGLTVGQIQDVIESAIGGLPASQTIEGRERYTISVRYARQFREDPQALQRVLVPAPSGTPVPLAQVADIRFRTGPPMIQEEDGQLVGLVSVDVADRALADYVSDAKRAVVRVVSLPPGYRIDWTGQFKYYERAKARLSFVVPLTLLLVFALLYFNLRSVPEAGIVMLAVPFSLVGAVWILWILHYHLSVAVWVGMIALAGLDAETGVVMLLYLKLAYQEHQARGALRDRSDLTDAIVEGAAHRIRPKMMTVCAILFGLLPIMWGQGSGADVMKRIAAPMVGGVVTSFILELAVYPAIFAWWKGRRLPERAEKGA
ncbi:MAG: efflux RND transporter permease subunit [Candidatus Eisenbacteria bacterium]|uniref:Efflux RND transporter permease subunit n=1 Tax=Eiseniibacteriota bacterium TaxID=2212470 RepID=A0A538T1M3_UNCEI|nr:MAG: efflux RND transporter permease subunit [Candidatus Eisenbacteria bacterium]